MKSKIMTPFDPKAFLAKTSGGRTISKYRRNQIVFSQGDPADSVFYIRDGKVKVTVLSEQGKEAVVAVLGPDEFCGEGCLTGQPRRMATATAMTECEIMRLEKQAAARYQECNGSRSAGAARPQNSRNRLSRSSRSQRRFSKPAKKCANV
jgi:CRP/FNR family cyclic AMP-dependent transcriptional regulator